MNEGLQFGANIRHLKGYTSGWMRISYGSGSLHMTVVRGMNVHSGSVDLVWHVPDVELIATAFRCAAGLMPLPIFADWLEDRRELAEATCDVPDEPSADRREAFNKLLAEMR